MRCHSHDHAISQARANAKTFGEAYIVFTDTNGVWNCERDRPQSPTPHERYAPDGTMTRYSPKVTP